MAYVIAEPCIDNSDQSCVAVCPVDCITADPDIDRKFYIDPDGCIDCGSCESACPNVRSSGSTSSHGRGRGSRGSTRRGTATPIRRAERSTRPPPRPRDDGCDRSPTEA